VQDFGDIAQRSRIAKAKLALVADKVLLAGLQTAGVDCDAITKRDSTAEIIGERDSRRSAIQQRTRNVSLNEEQFIISVLVEEGLVDDKMIRTLRTKFHRMIDDHNVCFADKDKKKAMDPELVYFHLKQQGRIVDRSTPKMRSTNVVRVDMSSLTRERLPGYSEWLRDHWTNEGPLAAKRLQRAARQHAARTALRDAVVATTSAARQKEASSGPLASSRNVDELEA